MKGILHVIEMKMDTTCLLISLIVQTFENQFGHLCLLRYYANLSIYSDMSLLPILIVMICGIRCWYHKKIQWYFRNCFIIDFLKHINHFWYELLKIRNFLRNLRTKTDDDSNTIIKDISSNVTLRVFYDFFVKH